MTSRAAIVGRAATTALGGDLEATCAAFRGGGSALAPWPSASGWADGPPHAARIAEAEPRRDEDATQRVLGRHGAWLVRVARAAHDEAGFAVLPRAALGLYVALGMVDALPEDLAPAVAASRDACGAFDLARFYAGGFRAMHPLWPLSMLGNVAAGHVAIDLDVRGDNTVLASDGLAGVRVLVEARRAIAIGAAQAALVAAAAEPVTEASLVRRRLAGTPLGSSAAPGSGPGEGAVALALESPLSAQARGATVHGWLAGAALASKEGAEAALLTEAGAADEAVDRALAEAGLDLGAIDLLLLTGAWSLPGERMLIRPRGLLGRLREAAATSGATLGVVSSSPALGDMLGAAPLAGVVLALESFAAGVPPAARTTWLVEGGATPRPGVLRRALVVLCSEAGCGALVVEAP